MIDVFSIYDDSHPVRHAGEARYLLAPPEREPGANGDPSTSLARFRQEMANFDRAIGGLLPILGREEHVVAAALDDPWWRGILLAPTSDGAEPAGLLDAQVFETLAWPEAELLPVVIDCGLEGFSRPEALRAFLDRCPTRPVVLTHGGQLNISGSHLDAAIEIFRLFPQTLLETSGIYRQDFLEAMFRDLGSSRILYGSGYPRMDEELERERVAILPASAEQLAAMFEGNARRLFGLGSAAA